MTGFSGFEIDTGVSIQSVGDMLIKWAQIQTS